MTLQLALAYDGSPAAEAAVATAGRLFGGAHGRVVTVVEPLPDVPGLVPVMDPGTAERRLEALSRELLAAGGEVAERGVASGRRAGLALEARPTIPPGAGWQAILAAAEAIDADALVCGSRGRGGLARSLLGSTSTSLVHHATRPVLVVPAGPAAIDGPALIAYDGSAGARAAIAAAGRLLRGRPAIVVHVWYSGIQRTLTGRALAAAPAAELRALAADYARVFADEARETADEGAALARAAGLEASGQAIEAGSGAWRALAEAADEHHAAVIACGSRGRGAVAATVLGSVSSGLVHNAHVPVLVVRPEEPDAPPAAA